MDARRRDRGPVTGTTSGSDRRVDTVPAKTPAPPLPAKFDRRFEAVVFDWDATALTDGQVDQDGPGSLVDELCDLGCDLAVIADAQVAEVDGRLGPARMDLAVSCCAAIMVWRSSRHTRMDFDRCTAVRHQGPTESPRTRPGPASPASRTWRAGSLPISGRTASVPSS
jgi:hypothetical protein